MKKHLITAVLALGLSTAMVPAHAGGADHQTFPESYDATEPVSYTHLTLPTKA